MQSSMQPPSAVAENEYLTLLARNPATLSRLAITTLLSQTGLSGDLLKYTPDESVAERTREIVKTWDLGGFNPRVFDAVVEASIGIATITYPHIPPSAQLYVSLYTVIAIAIDDFACPVEALNAFSDRMRTGSPQLHPLLDRLVEVLDDTANHFPAIASREIVRGTMAFVDSNAMECEAPKEPLRPGMFAYVLAKRQANGVGRAYANFVWDKTNFPNYFTYMQAAPDMEMYFDKVNDIMSFYKEELAGEKGNFISERGVVTNRGTAGALLDTVDEAVASVASMRSILEGTRELEACEVALEGYVVWHCLEKRYRLAEILNEN